MGGRTKIKQLSAPTGDVGKYLRVQADGSVQAEEVSSGGVTESVTPPGASTISRVLPAGTLGADNETLEIEVWGVNTSGGSSDVVQLVFGSTLLLSMGVGASFSPFMIKATILRTGASAQLVHAHGSQGIGTATVENNRAAGTENLATPITLTASDQSGNLAFDAMIVRKWPA